MAAGSPVVPITLELQQALSSVVQRVRGDRGKVWTKSNNLLFDLSSVDVVDSFE